MGQIRQIMGFGIAVILLALPLRAEPTVIFAAASLKTALDEVIEQQDLDAIAVYGGSAAIARQVAQGAEADIVILAHPDWMDWLEDQGALEKSSRCDVLANTLVLAGVVDAPDLSVKNAVDLIKALEGGRLAVGQLRSVPAGQYTAAYLHRQGWLSALRAHLAETSNVRLALALIARGETPLGFVYASDVTAEPRVRAVFTPEKDQYPAIRYPMALIAGAGREAHGVARAIANAEQVFERNGFSTLPLTDADRCQ
jgi:molybdate transport system substrate-binding protein